MQLLSRYINQNLFRDHLLGDGNKDDTPDNYLCGSAQHNICKEESFDNDSALYTREYMYGDVNNDSNMLNTTILW